MKGFDILALDENFEILTILNYNILQWNRKWYESGYFSIYIPIETYDKRMKYVYTKDRPEMGMIEQVNYFIETGIKYVVISGYFLENILSRMVVFQKIGDIEHPHHSNFTNNNDRTLYSGNAEEVACSIFRDFREIVYNGTDGQHFVTLPVTFGPDTYKGRGKHSEHTRGNEKLSNKVYTILKPSKLSYRVYKDFDDRLFGFKLNIIEGKDRSADNKKNKPVVFSTQYGNIIKADVLISSTEWRNAYMVMRDGLEPSTQWAYFGSEEDSSDLYLYNSRVLFVASAESREDYSSDQTYFNALKTAGHEALYDYPQKLSIDIDTIESNYEYLTDYDIGDTCSIEIPEIGLSVDGVVSGVYEVIKEGVMRITLEFTIQEET